MKVLQMFTDFYGVFYKYRQFVVTKYFTNNPEFVQFFQKCQAFQEATKNVDKLFSKTNKTVTRKSV